MTTIRNRLNRLKEQLRAAGDIRVTFRNGTSRIMPCGECIPLLLDCAEDIQRFEAQGAEDSTLADLLNGMLDSDG